MAVERKLIKEHKKRVAVREFLHRETERAGFGGVAYRRLGGGIVSTASPAAATVRLLARGQIASFNQWAPNTAFGCANHVLPQDVAAVAEGLLLGTYRFTAYKRARGC